MCRDLSVSLLLLPLLSWLLLLVRAIAIISIIAIVTIITIVIMWFNELMFFGGSGLEGIGVWVLESSVLTFRA